MSSNGNGNGTGTDLIDLVEEASRSNLYRCKNCHTHLALRTDILSRQFNTHNGKAYLFHKVGNVSYGPREEKTMMTGKHDVVDIFCAGCQTNLGWKYEVAYAVRQKYKEGKYVVDRSKISVSGGSGGSDDDDNA